MSALVVTTFKRVSDPKLRTDDNRVDRLSHRYTSTILIIFAVLVSTQQYVGKPILCWAPVQFKPRHVDYANSYCWVSGTFHFPFNSSNVPKLPERSTFERSTYYQWVPIILLVQALLFNVPCLLWRSLSERSGLDLNSIIITGQMLATVQMSKDIREGLLSRMVRQVNRYIGSFDHPRLSLTLSIKHVFSRTCCFLCGHRQGNYLTSLYTTTKILYVINAVGQLFALDLFLGQDYHAYGVEVIRAAIRGDDWTGSYRFPRVNLCDFKLRRMGSTDNIQQHTLQCVLPINLFNEKIFLFLWFWLIVVALITTIDLAAWIIKIFIPRDRHRFIKRLLMMSKDLAVTDSRDRKERVILFVEKHLQQDGVFLLRLIQHTTNMITTMELTTYLWKTYLEKMSSTGSGGENGPTELGEGSSEAPTIKIPSRWRIPKQPTAPPEEKLNHKESVDHLPNNEAANSKALEALQDQPDKTVSIV